MFKNDSDCSKCLQSKIDSLSLDQKYDLSKSLDKNSINCQLIDESIRSEIDHCKTRQVYSSDMISEELEMCGGN